MHLSLCCLAIQAQVLYRKSSCPVIRALAASTSQGRAPARLSRRRGSSRPQICPRARPRPGRHSAGGPLQSLGPGSRLRTGQPSRLLRAVRWCASLQKSCGVSCGQLWPAVARCGQLWRAMVSCGEPWKALASCGELRQAVASCRELSRAVARCGQLWRAVASCGELL